MSMAKRDGSIWVNGSFVNWEKSKFSCSYTFSSLWIIVFEGDKGL